MPAAEPTPYYDFVCKYKKVYFWMGVLPWAWMTGVPETVWIQIFGVTGSLRMLWSLHYYSRSLKKATKNLEEYSRRFSGTDHRIPNAERAAFEDEIDAYSRWFNKRFAPDCVPVINFKELRERVEHGRDP